MRTLSLFLEHRKGGSGQMWGMSWGCARALRNGKSFPAGLHMRPAHVRERPGTELMNPGQEQQDPSKPWVCSFVHSFIHSFFISHRPPLCPARDPAQHIPVSPCSSVHRMPAMGQAPWTFASSHPRAFALAVSFTWNCPPCQALGTAVRPHNHLLREALPAQCCPPIPFLYLCLMFRK